MRTTFYRIFAKQLAVGFPAFIVVSSMTMAAVGQEKRPPKPTGTSPQTIFTSHDTPPPVTIMDGSFIVEIQKADFDEKDEPATNPKKYKLKPRVEGKKLYLAHIKIVDGSGELLYRGDYHDQSSDLNVIITTPEGDLVTFASVGNKFQIDTPSGKKLAKTIDLDQPVGSKRLGRFRFKTDGGVETRLRRITVKKGNDTVYDVDLTGLADGGKETRVLIWLAETT